ncbi:sensor histidine kinase [Nonlabens xiamenensis]|uniref:sensor histidine kinase n=1 Tax=Nonlabens xiamenensis TaxID=2341043 RepID=UPI000F607710|nr:histidine kinase [Nonlabens xiamenensis]
MRVFVFLYLLIGFQAVFAQQLEPVKYQLSTEHGLPDNEVYAIIADQEHNLWLSTNSGTFKYNGRSFEHFHHEKQKGQSTFGIIADSSGTLWYNNGYGQIFSINNDKVSLRYEFDRVPLSYVEKINVFDDLIYVSGREKIVIFDTLSGEVKTHDYQSQSLPATNVDVSPNGAFTIKGNYLLNLHREGHTIQAMDLTNLKLPKNRGFLFHFEEDIYGAFPNSNGNLFFSILQQKELMGAFKEIDDASINFIKKIDETLWFFTSNGAYRYSFSNDKFHYDSHYLKDHTVTNLVVDHDENLIFSTLNDGLFIIEDPTIKVLQLTDFAPLSSINSLTNGRQGEIYFLVNQRKLVNYNTITGKATFKNISRHQDQLLYYDKLKNRLWLFNNQVATVFDADLHVIDRFSGIARPKDFKRASKNAFIAGYYNSVMLVDEELNPIQSIPIRTSIVENTKEKLYYSSINGVFVTDHDLMNNMPLELNGKAFKANKIVSGQESDIVYAVSNQKLFTIDSSTVKPHTFQYSLKEELVIDIAYKEPFLTVLTDKGLYDYHTTTHKQLNYPFSLPKNIRKNLKQILPVANQLWMTDGKGLYMKSKESKSLLPTKEIELTMDGLWIDKNSVKFRNDQTIEIEYNSTVKMIPWVNQVNSSRQYNYYYTLDEEEWHTLEAGDAISLSGLPVGKNTLLIQAEDKLTQSESNLLSIHFEVAAPYFKTWWFYAVIFLLCLLTTGAFYSIFNAYRNRRWEHKITSVQNEKRLVQLQLENLRSQMNPHFLFNALNSLQDHIISNEQKEASKFLVKFSKLMRMFLDHSRSDVITLDQEIETLELYLSLEKKRFNNQLTYKIKIDPSINRFKTMVPSLFLQPYIENALLHGLLNRNGKKELSIVFSKYNNSLFCRISDNGIGREAAAELAKQRQSHRPFGTMANNKRIQLINSGGNMKLNVEYTDHTDTNGQATGTSILIKLFHEHLYSYH